ncbi:YopX family protein [Mesotoga prima]|uniref:YopX family protein n=1 Tax=Mesotoga prima TaxID=1184387 RepID=UPI002FD999D8
MNWKFRIWSLSEMKMYSPTKIEVCMSETTAKIFDGKKHHTLMNNKLVGIEQFKLMANVGLRDGEGKEIYDQDILETGKGRGVVYFQPTRGAYVVNLFGKGEVMFDEVKHSVKVLGDVFRNPELIAESVEVM